MPSITSWTRLEPRARSETMATSLQARIHDPLWLLARQWQFGEFQGEDAASPVKVELQTEQSRLEKLRLGPPTTTADIQTYSAGVPLETLVERERVHTAEEVNHRIAAEAGLQFLRLLGSTLASKYRGKLLQAYPIDPSPTSSAQRDNASSRFLGVVALRVLDGGKLYQNLAGLRGAGLPLQPTKVAIEPADVGKVISTATDWLTWYESLFSEPEGESAWVSEQMEYALSVSAPVNPSPSIKNELTLVTSEYYQGHLDWYSFEADTDSTHQLGAAGNVTTEKEPQLFLPTPIHFRGMPATRWWEFEDAGVNFGGIEAAPEDLARLLLTEFTLIYGNDFFVVPVDLEVGSICRVTNLEVTNTFGEVIPIKSASEAGGSIASWRMFQLSQLDEQPGNKRKPLDYLFLPPVLGLSLEGDIVEEVTFLRDEMANMAWAIERIVESPIGQPLNRFEAYQEKQRRKEELDPASTVPSSGPLEYRLATTVPDYWIPLIPIHTDSLKRDIELHLGGLNKPLGQLLKPEYPTKLLSLHEEEVPREGAIVARTYQYARWTDGSTHLWIGRRKRTGRGEGSSGLRFDIVEPSEEA